MLLNPTQSRRAYRLPEFCAAYGISRSALYSLWAAGGGPRFFKVGAGEKARIVIPVDEAEAWLRARVEEHNGEAIR